MPDHLCDLQPVLSSMNLVAAGFRRLHLNDIHDVEFEPSDVGCYGPKLQCATS